MILTKDVHRRALSYNTWVSLVLLQVNTVVFRLLGSAEERLENKVLLIERSFSESIFLSLYLSYIVPVFRRR